MKKYWSRSFDCIFIILIFAVTIGLTGCNEKSPPIAEDAVVPLIVTEKTKHDTDDPAIWIHPTDPSQSMIIGTDKNVDGALYVFDLNGKIDEEKTVRNLQRPNNVDIEYGLVLAGIPVDIAVTTERLTNKLRVFSLPDMKPIDNGGIDVFEDETVGIRKYYADPDVDDANVELALFGTEGFTEDHEGISIYTINDGTGYILVSDQQANAFRIFRREGERGNPHDHRLIKVINVSTNESDGSDVTNGVLNRTFPAGLFVAMSDDKTFQFYSWADIAGNDLMIAPNGTPK